MYVGGGTPNLDTVYEYTVATGEWAAKNSLPVRVSVHVTMRVAIRMPALTSLLMPMHMSAFGLTKEVWR